MRMSTSALAAATGLGLTALGAAPATAAPAPAPVSSASYSGSTGSAAEAKADQALFEAVIKSVAEKRAANPNGPAAVTVVYNASQAPTFSSQIASSTQIWNSAVSNVKLQEGSASAADFTYREGDDPRPGHRGSHANTDWHGKGYIFLDYAQSKQYDPIRITAHETGHVLGLLDHYEGPCSELMSGGGPGTSCTNPNPDAAERSKVNQLWVNGFAKALDKALQKAGR
ncbi:snapalysin [Streptomyces avermitilis]|uniref:snapalysin n=1 Tax=Streptomyces avermitilis TaxID=33903 RepID=UPI0033AA7C68